MGSCYGENIRLMVFGQSHAPAVGVTVEGIPAGEAVDMERLRAFLARRAPGNSEFATARHEADEPEFLSGLHDGVTCGAPLTAILHNRDVRTQDYAETRYVPRPGHADFTAWAKYGEARDYAGGGHFSGRLTAPLCIAGGICLQILERHGIRVSARAVEIGGETEKAAMDAAIRAAKTAGDSVGGVVECVIDGVPPGLGDPMFGGLENRIAGIVFGIPAVKGVEFGVGFAAARLHGSEHNDAFIVRNGAVETKTNRCGGILGGISTGMPVVFRVAFKPTPSIETEQESVDLRTMESVQLRVRGRHDPCIVPRALPVVEAAAAIAIYDALLSRRKERE